MKCEPYEILWYDASSSSVHFHHASAAHSSSCLCICDDDSLTRVLVNSKVALGLRLLGNSLSKYSSKQSDMDCCHTHFVLSKEYLPLIGLHFKFDLQSLSYKYWGCNLFLKNPVTTQVVQRLVQSSSLSLQFSSQWLCIGSANLAPMWCDWRTVQAGVMHTHQIGVSPVNCNSSSEGLSLTCRVGCIWLSTSNFSELCSQLSLADSVSGSVTKVFWTCCKTGPLRDVWLG